MTKIVWKNGGKVEIILGSRLAFSPPHEGPQWEAYCRENNIELPKISEENEMTSTCSLQGESS